MRRIGSRGGSLLVLLSACFFAHAASAQSSAQSSAAAPQVAQDETWRDGPTDAPPADRGPGATMRAILAPDWRAPDGAYGASGAYGANSEVRRYWRGRREPQYGHRGIAGWFDVRAGFYDTQDVSKNDWTLGMKVMSKVTPQLSLGLAADLSRRAAADRIIESQYTDPTRFDEASNAVLEVHVPAIGVDP